MAEPPSIPSFAVVGHPNEGKSSVVATLAEDDQIRISNVPGETLAHRVYPVRLDGSEILRFVDTPGFQQPQAMLAWMREHEAGEANLARAFLDQHRSNPDYAQDNELLIPLAEGSGVIYVVDGSRPVRRHDLAEMEILRLIGNPRMAVINPKESGSDYSADWKRACAKCFNAIRVFDAHQASYAERIALLESLKSMHQDWEPALARAIDAFQQDWARRNHQVASLLCGLLREALQHNESRSVFEPSREEEARHELVRKYQAAIHEMEQRAQKEMRRLFKHNIFHLDIPEQSILREDLFTEKTWQLLGLSKRQILWASTVLGAGVGLQLDVAFGHLTFGLLTLSGAALGLAAAWLKGENMARARVRRLKLGGIQVSVGPNRNPQFPFVLLDRMLLYYRHTINWAHARRDSEPVQAPAGEEEKLGFTSTWPQERRKICLAYVKAVTTGKRDREEKAERALQAMLEQALQEISEEGRGPAEHAVPRT